MQTTRALYLRTVIFGITDSLVSTVGLLAGIDVAGASHRMLALTGIVYAFVEAFSMAVGNFLSEESSEEYAAHADVPDSPSLFAAVVMFVVFVLAALIPLAPYLLLRSSYALLASIGLSIATLFIAGVVGGAVSRVPILWRGVRMALLGGAAITLGVLIGFFLPAA